MFKTLASFFKPKGQATEDATDDSGAPQPPVGESADADENDEEESEEETSEDTHEDAQKPSAGISTERYNALLAAEAELKKFGATPAARADFLAETRQLFTWYNNVKSVGVKNVAQDANQEQKTKTRHKSSVTKEAEALEAKRAGK
ncbi:hypothetical protein [Lacihabitans soyangensis]|uniref:Uncharacterized protein n=1 Tax=Lacihabitans soyangensis TaxID=869394 RepID=A0AAE3H639_9BACT|nr:hypothetical protein [Lacihabitans soyangensis]MCP9765147.1 hypothetical protein [Lacihabitans soyangensis]